MATKMAVLLAQVLGLESYGKGQQGPSNAYVSLGESLARQLAART